MAEQHDSNSRRPSHARPSQAHPHPANGAPQLAKDQQWVRDSQRAQRVDLFQNLAQRAHERNAHRQQHDMPQSARLPSYARRPSNRVPPPRLPDVPDNQAPRNSVLVRHLATGRLSSSALATPVEAEFWLPMRTGHYQPPQVASDSEEESDPRTVEQPGPASHSREQFPKSRQFDANQQIWQHINALQQNFERVEVANQMQEVLSYAVSIFYHGLGFQVLAQLDELQDKAHKMELRVINAQAQLWRAIILDEMGEGALVPELLADALLLMPAVAGCTLSVIDAAPEDADFYQLWRLILVRSYGLELWRYLQREDAKERPNEQLKDLYLEKSFEEAQDWVAYVLDMLGNCFERKDWPGPKQGRNARRPSSLSSSSTLTVGAASATNYETPVQQSRSPTKEQLEEDNMMKAQIIGDLEAQELEYEQAIGSLQADIARYKAERAVFDENLSTCNPYDASSPYEAVEEIWPKSIPREVDFEMVESQKSANYQNIREGNDLRRGITPSPAHKPIQQRLSVKLKLRPTRSSAFAQDLAYRNRVRPIRLAPGQRPGHEYDTVVFADRQELGHEVNPDFAPGYYKGRRLPQTGYAENFVDRWAEKAHGGRSLSPSSSVIRQPFSPNTIPPSEPSGKSWRHRKDWRSSTASISSDKDRNPRSDQFWRKNKNDPSQAWRTNNVAANPSSSSGSGLSGAPSYSGDDGVHRHPSSASSSPLPDESKRVRRASELESRDSSWLVAKALKLTPVAGRGNPARPVSYERFKPDHEEGGGHAAVSGAKKLHLRQPLDQSYPSSGYGEKTYEEVSQSPRTPPSSGYGEKTTTPLAPSNQKASNNGFYEKTETPRSSSQQATSSSSTGGVELPASSSSARGTSSGSESASGVATSSSLSQQAAPGGNVSGPSSKGETPLILAQQPLPTDDNSSQWSRSSDFTIGAPASPKAIIPLPRDHHRQAPPRPSSHPSSHRPSYRPSPAACSPSNHIHRPSSPSTSVSPLTTLEKLPLTDTPSLDEIEQRCFHIREYKEQRRRSMSSNSSASISPNNYEAERWRLPSSSIQIERSSRNLSEVSMVSKSDLTPVSIDEPLQSSNDDSGKSSGAPIRPPTSDVSFYHNGVEDMSVTSGSIKETPPTTDRSSDGQESDVGSQPDLGYRRLSSEVNSTLKLQMPPLHMTSYHNRRESVLPACPSPLQETFKAGDEDEDMRTNEKPAETGKDGAVTAGAEQPKMETVQQPGTRDGHDVRWSRADERVKQPKGLIVKQKEEAQSKTGTKRQDIYQKRHGSNSPLSFEGHQAHPGSQQLPLQALGTPSPELTRRINLQTHNIQDTNLEKEGGNPIVKLVNMLDSSAPTFVPDDQIRETSSVIKPPSPTALIRGAGTPVTSSHRDSIQGEICQPARRSAEQRQSIYDMISDAYGTPTPTSPCKTFRFGERTNDGQGPKTQSSPKPISPHKRSSSNLAGSWADDEDSYMDSGRREREQREMGDDEQQEERKRQDEGASVEEEQDEEMEGEDEEPRNGKAGGDGKGDNGRGEERDDCHSSEADGMEEAGHSKAETPSTVEGNSTDDSNSLPKRVKTGATFDKSGKQITVAQNF